MPDVSPTQANNKYLSLLRSATTTKVATTATKTKTIAAANIYNNEQEAATLAANVWLQVAFWAKPHSQLIATTTPTTATKVVGNSCRLLAHKNAVWAETQLQHGAKEKS